MNFFRPRISLGDEIYITSFHMLYACEGDALAYHEKAWVVFPIPRFDEEWHPRRTEGGGGAFLTYDENPRLAEKIRFTTMHKAS